MAVIEAHRLTKQFGDIVAVDELTFELGHGTVTGFLGPNGAGKTTTLRMLLGLVAPDAGSATINGRPYRELDEPARHVGAVLDGNSFHPGRRGRDHLRLLASAAGFPSRRAEEALDQVELTGAAGRRIGGYSLGMRQRLALAAALLGDPEVLILDEPANGLDPEGIHWLRSFLRRFAAGRTVLVSSHVLSEVALTVDDVLIVAHGRLVSRSTLAGLPGSDGPVIQVRSPQAAALRRALEDRGISAGLAAADRVTATGTTPEVVGQLAATLGLVVYELTVAQPDLESAFLALTTR